jgi:hypothetical protein
MFSTFEEMKVGSEGKDTPNHDDVLAAAAGNYYPSVISIDTRRNTVFTCAPTIGLKEYAYDKVFNELTKQKEVFVGAGAKAVVDVMNGINASVIVYGQTGNTSYWHGEKNTFFWLFSIH